MIIKYTLLNWNKELVVHNVLYESQMEQVLLLCKHKELC